MDDKAKKTWISVVIAIVIIIAVAGLTLAGGAAFWIRRHVVTQFTSAEVAGDQFSRERARFTGQQPLIELQAGDEPVIHRRSAAGRPELHAIRVLAFDPRAGKLVSVSIPFWILRLAPNHELNLHGDQGIDFDRERIHLTVDDVERAGPGLILDTRDRRNGAQVLVWAE